MKTYHSINNLFYYKNFSIKRIFYIFCLIIIYINMRLYNDNNKNNNYYNKYEYSYLKRKKLNIILIQR